MTLTGYYYLYKVDSPDDLKKLSVKELTLYCGELRRYIIEQLAENPGHFASSLGAVELATALHYVFDTPHDKIVWDVGHQAYAHKIITSRRDIFSTNRKAGGISGFPRISESEYDAFGGGHSSVSISAALGMAAAAEIKGEHRQVVAVIGDGALTGGLAFEGLNNAGAMNTDILVILNDNQMSIDPNVGALKEYLMRMSTSKRYNKFKSQVWNALSGMPRLRRILQSTGNMIKQSIFQRSNLFESLNFRYFGPVDGHDVRSLTRVLCDLKNIRGPKLLHIMTVKGKGYKPAESKPGVWHAPGMFDPETGERIIGTTGSPPRYQDVFGNTLLELARMDDRIVGITPAMPSGCSMNIMINEMPDRCFDVGIAEGHAVTFSAGLAASGMLPFCNIYSSFVQRAYDNVIHDVALQNLPVVICLDRAGLVGEDGATHQGEFDIAFFRCIPNITIASPMDERELRNMMYTAYKSRTPFVIRYPRGYASGVDMSGGFDTLPVGVSSIRRKGDDIAVLSFGHVGNFVADAATRAETDGVSVMHIDLRYAKPLDEQMLHNIGSRFSNIITVEDGILAGGVGSAIMEFMNNNDYGCRIHAMGIDDLFVEHGTQAEQYRLCGYDPDSIYARIKDVAKQE